MKTTQLHKSVIILSLLFFILILSFGSSFALTDSESPVIDIDQLAISQEQATVGDDVIISVPITDNIAVTSAYIHMQNAATGMTFYSLHMSYNETTQRWEYSFHVSNEIPDGVWQIMSVAAYDEIGNLASHAIYQDAFTVYGAGDAIKPVIDIDQLTISRSQATIGDDVIISVPITDNIAVTSAYIHMQNAATGMTFYSLHMSYNETTQRWEYNFHVSNEIPDGVWQIMSVAAYDEIGNLASHAIYQDAFITESYFDFEHADGLKLPSQLTIIDDEAFYQCNAETVVIPSSCKRIGKKAFAYSVHLKRILIPETTTNIAGNAFYGCGSPLIYGQAGSYAEQFASEHGLSFIALD